MLSSPTIMNITPALIKAQKAMGDATKGSKNPFFKSAYSDLNSVREAVTPALHANDIMILQPTVYIGGKQFIQTTLLHSSGEWIAGVTEVTVAKLNDPQAAGSGISYSRRYGLMALLSVGTIDDDGEKAMDRAPVKLATKLEDARKVPEVAAAPTAPTSPVVKPNSSFKPKKAVEAAPAPQVAAPQPTASNGAQTNDGW